MADLALLGAGFSRNWGGWLATEAFEYLLGTQEVKNNAYLRELLWKHAATGGFEDALGELQILCDRDRQNHEPLLMDLQKAVSQMFNDMNKAFMSITDWQFGEQYQQHQISTFLSNFDAIFTLNQDLLLEHHYANRFNGTAGKKKFTGSQFPGMRRIPSQEAFYSDSWSHSTWIPDESSFCASDSLQPIYKLHGSSNWRTVDNDKILITGTNKDWQIKHSPILVNYADTFSSMLLQKNTKLMIIGYSFRDPHINLAITNAVKQNGLKTFIIDPHGADIVKSVNRTTSDRHIRAQTEEEMLLMQSMIGGSRRTLSETFSSDRTEFMKVMRFFED